VTIWAAALGWLNTMFVIGLTAEEIGTLAAIGAGLVTSALTVLGIWGRLRATKKLS
jgi:hypothetical protein